MSTTRLYRALLKSAKQYDVYPWKRPTLLQHHKLQPFLQATTDGTTSHKPTPAANGVGGCVQYFLQSQQSQSTQAMVKQQFRLVNNKNVHVQQALSRGFEILRLLNGNQEVSSTPTTISAANTSSSTSTVAPPHIRSTHATNSLPFLTSPSTDSSSGVTRSYSDSTTGGPALRRKPHQLVIECASSSLLGYLHQDGVELQKPRTPTPTAATTAAAESTKSVTNPNHDSNYMSSMFQLSIIADEYLKLLSAASSTNSSTLETPTIHSSSTMSHNALEAGHELYLIESSRMKQQAEIWESTMIKLLSHEQQVALEGLVQTLGVAVQNQSIEDVLLFQTNLTRVERSLLAPLLSNNKVLDAWLSFLYEQKEFTSMISLFKSRLSSHISLTDFSLSRQSACKILVACAMEGDIISSMMCLRETSWASLTKEIEAPAATTATQTYAASEPDVEVAAMTNSLLSTLPSSVNRLPSWIPKSYYTESTSLATRSSYEENEPDLFLSAAIEDETDVAPISAPAPISQPYPRVNIIHPRPHRSIPTSSLSSLSSLLSTSLLHPPTIGPQSSRAASMSTRAHRSRPEMVVRVPTPSAAPPMELPPTPVPMIDLWTELSLDSRLLELVVLAAIRSESRAIEFSERQQSTLLKEHAQSNPISSNPEINLSIHEHIAKSFGLTADDQHSMKKRSSGVQLDLESPILPDDGDELELDDDNNRESTAPKTISEMLKSSSSSPLAFQLWSLMLSQKIPLQHSNTFVQLIQNLGQHLKKPQGIVKVNEMNLLLQTLTSEMSFSRSSPAILKHKFLRSDLETFLKHELELNLLLSTMDAHNPDYEAQSTDHLWSSLNILRTIQSEHFQPPIEAITNLCKMMLYESAPGFGRSKLLSELMVLLDDLQISSEVIEAVAAMEKEQI